MVRKDRITNRSTLNRKKRIRLGILGCRGIPNRYGGYEQFAQYLSQGMVDRGHEVWVYNSSLHPYQEPEWNGVHLIHCFDPEDKLGAAGQFVYDLNCLRDAKKRPFDVLLQLGYTSSALWYRLWPKQMIHLMHMDGLEWKRTKYTPPIQRFLLKMEAWAAKQADVLIADSVAIATYIEEKYERVAPFIPYGAASEVSPDIEDLTAWNIQPKQYTLAIARFVPENHLEEIIQGVLASDTSDPLLVVGNNDQKFGTYLSSRYDSPKIRFVGGIYDLKVLDSLRFYARLYFHGHSVGGTNPSLLEAMACEVPICAHDNPFNRSVLGENAYYFTDSNEVAAIVSRQETESLAREWVSNNKSVVATDYSWEKIIDAYEALFERALAGDRS